MPRPPPIASTREPASSERPRVPRDSLGKYRLTGLVAEGGMAELFLAAVTGVEGFSKRVVLKVILPHLARDPDFVAMFVDEAKLAAQLTHPNIVQVHELGSIERRYYIAMEYVEGCDLARLRDLVWTRGESFPPGAVLAIATEVLRGLTYAHDKCDDEGRPLQIVHRDVSPQNILISKEGVVKLTDFGIAKAQSRSTKTETGVIKGKYGYMPPEQALGDPVDRRADLFSLAVVLYELFLGRRLYDGESGLRVLELAKRAAFPSLADASPGFPRTVSDVIVRALAAPVDARFASANELSQALVDASVGWAPAWSPAELADLMRRFAPELKAAAPKPLNDGPAASVEERTLAGNGEALATPTSRHAPRGRMWLGGTLVLAVAALFVVPRLGPTPEPSVATPVAPTSVTNVQQQSSSGPQTKAEPQSEPQSKAVAPPASKAAGFGYLTVNSQPWSYVYVDGRKLAKPTPVDRLKLSAGTHRIRLHSPPDDQTKELVVEIEAGKTVDRIVVFDVQSPSGSSP